MDSTADKYCPLCGKPNHCAMAAATGSSKQQKREVSCWCHNIDILEGPCTKDSFCSSKAKMIEKPEFTGVNEDFEIIFNAAGTENMNRAKVSPEALREEIPAAQQMKTCICKNCINAVKAQQSNP